MAVAWYWLLCSSLALYAGWLVISRLFLSPLARFPGPRLAALSNWYEFYYDVLLQGQFTAHIQELHKKYGPFPGTGSLGQSMGLVEADGASHNRANHSHHPDRTAL
jgi:hypothetical protein